MKEMERTMTTNGSILRPGESSVYSLSIVLEDPPAPAAREELGLVDAAPAVARRLSWPPAGRSTPVAPGRPGGPVGEATPESESESDAAIAV